MELVAGAAGPGNAPRETIWRSMERPGRITSLLGGLEAGDERALDELFPLLYQELRTLARQRLSAERPDHTLRPTALVHEVYLRLLNQEAVRVADRSQFFAAASETMRRILVDHARARSRLKRGGGRKRVDLDTAESFLTERQADEVIALEDALERLRRINGRAFRVVRYRFFGGLTVDEAAAVMGLSSKTVKRSWAAARAWLRKEIARDLDLGAD